MFASAHSHFSRRGLALAAVFAAGFAFMMMHGQAAHAAVQLIV